VGAERVGLGAAPRQIPDHRPPVGGSDAVSPVVAGNEVPAGPAHRRHLEAIERVEDVGAVAVPVGVGAGRVVDATVDRPPQVL